MAANARVRHVSLHEPAGLRGRCTRIKAALLAQYGQNSPHVQRARALTR